MGCALLVPVPTLKAGKEKAGLRLALWKQLTKEGTAWVPIKSPVGVQEGTAMVPGR